jgi:hypothetical protein
MKAVPHILASSAGTKRGQPGVYPGSTWGQPGVNSGSTWGQPGKPGSTWDQPWVNPGSTWVNLHRPAQQRGVVVAVVAAETAVPVGRDPPAVVAVPPNAPDGASARGT